MEKNRIAKGTTGTSKSPYVSPHLVEYGDVKKVTNVSGSVDMSATTR
jgi:hypothetical protein